MILKEAMRKARPERAGDPVRVRRECWPYGLALNIDHAGHGDYNAWWHAEDYRLSGDHGAKCSIPGFWQPTLKDALADDWEPA